MREKDSEAMYTYHHPGEHPAPEEIFVFGSNLAGRHGKGAALDAVKKYGARYGTAWGPQGKSYAIPTKAKPWETLNLDAIYEYIYQFKKYAMENHELRFFITAIGTGLAGYKHEEIAPLFKGAPHNCRFPIEWAKYLENNNNDSKEDTSN